MVLLTDTLSIAAEKSDDRCGEVVVDSCGCGCSGEVCYKLHDTRYGEDSTIQYTPVIIIVRVMYPTLQSYVCYNHYEYSYICQLNLMSVNQFMQVTCTILMYVTGNGFMSVRAMHVSYMQLHVSDIIALLTDVLVAPMASS